MELNKVQQPSFHARSDGDHLDLQAYHPESFGLEDDLHVEWQGGLSYPVYCPRIHARTGEDHLGPQVYHPPGSLDPEDDLHVEYSMEKNHLCDNSISFQFIDFGLYGFTRVLTDYIR